MSIIYFLQCENKKKKRMTRIGWKCASKFAIDQLDTKKKTDYCALESSTTRMQNIAHLSAAKTAAQFFRSSDAIHASFKSFSIGHIRYLTSASSQPGYLRICPASMLSPLHRAK